ncbi:hypothetical protein J416_01794 [Gracilibacillus halophilus YIM-C55.5]|uniref:DUF2268 domain-containing protein n=1 Tax=Gracilibacillus halophilus YIM-C55.5 TaxID=1308866 RepID=N4WPY4_9BACI|nr:DUF2268 domain-containing putative Zn-dependent protease [Gracilibacillus halophilus]ENH98187.1 hypothetical protein J416_01794 [Gracilibacillus halophilus YIM-C55.5]
MSIKPTEKWLADYTRQIETRAMEPARAQIQSICQPLQHYFQQTDATTIQQHFIRHGLFSPTVHDKHMIQKWVKRNYRRVVNKLFQKLRKQWNGPDTTVFILPSDERSHELREWFHGNAGLSFQDKVFLFVSTTASSKQLAAVLIHEYNHTCRLHYLSKEDDAFDVTDAILLEGIAEYTVRQILGADYGNQWLEKFSAQEAQTLWQKWIQTQQHITRFHPLHDKIMYGGGTLPKNFGYHMGYHIIRHYCQKHQCSIKQLLYTHNEDILESFTDDKANN